MPSKQALSLSYLHACKTWGQWLALDTNSEDPDETLHLATFDQRLHCYPLKGQQNTSENVVC